ncbi:hypothetical protein CsSME_00032860 [Camellia sinensis var. sinensis]
MIMMMNAAVGNIFPFLPSLSKTLSYSSSPTLFFPILSPRTRSTRSLVIETSTVAEAQTSEEARSESVARRLILLRHAKSSWDDRSLRGIPFLPSLPTSPPYFDSLLRCLWKMCLLLIMPPSLLLIPLCCAVFCWSTWGGLGNGKEKDR